MVRYDSPAKRPRINVHENLQHAQSPLDMISEIHHAVTTAQRCQIIDRLFQMIKYDKTSRFCHTDPQYFMCLVESGIVNALGLQLGFVLNGRETSTDEIEQICTAMDVFYRFCPEAISEKSLRGRGKETLRLLSGAMRRGVILPVVSMWHSWSSSPFGALLLSEDISFLESISEGLRIRQFCGESCLEVLGLLKNVSFYGQGDIRQHIVQHPVLLPSLTSLSGMELPEKGQERLSAILRNLALSPTTRAFLAQRGNVLTCVVRLSNNATTDTLRNLVNALVSMAMDQDSCLLMILHGEGMILELLKRFMFYEKDGTVRKRAARILRLMARESSVQLLVHDSKLLQLLFDRALNDPISEVRSEAAEAFGRCAGLTKAAMDQHEAVLGALTRLADAPLLHPDAIARAVKEQAGHPENRVPLSKCENLLGALAKIALAPDVSLSAKENVCTAFLDLSSDKKTMEAVTSQATLTALVYSAETSDARQSSIREMAVQTLVNLANHPANRKCMAKQSRLIQSLLHFAASTSSDSLKKEVKLVLLELAAEL